MELQKIWDWFQDYVKYNNIDWEGSLRIDQQKLSFGGLVQLNVGLWKRDKESGKYKEQIVFIVKGKEDTVWNDAVRILFNRCLDIVRNGIQ